MGKPKKRNYFIMDGRATYDVDVAMVIESFTARNDQAAFDYLKKEWDGYDYVVVDDKMKIIYGDSTG